MPDTINRNERQGDGRQGQAAVNQVEEESEHGTGDTPGNIKAFRKLLQTSPFGFDPHNADMTARHVGDRCPTFQVDDFTRMEVDNDMLALFELPAMEARRVSNVSKHLVKVKEGFVWVFTL